MDEFVARKLQSVGKAFGDFQRVLDDFPVKDLHYTIPDFHNTRKKYGWQ